MNLPEAEAFILDKLRTELSDTLYYHSLDHTLDVSEAVERIAGAEEIADEETLTLLRTAALFHDAGFITTYKGHESESCRMAHEYLPQFDYEPRQIVLISGMIEATRIPQTPKNKLEEILADADLDYLGRPDYEPIAYSLYREMHARDLVEDEAAWNQIQINFIEKHQYWTAYAQTIRQPAKYYHLRRLKKEAPRLRSGGADRR
ncbi:HD domain-containing protein [Persicitalea sp.]|uniref:HD domain-containing protein n=1 Tax=Persicitalea sp. TaxID=3100273 RepID=UPI00359390BA